MNEYETIVADLVRKVMDDVDAVIKRTVALLPTDDDKPNIYVAAAAAAVTILAVFVRDEADKPSGEAPPLLRHAPAGVLIMLAGLVAVRHAQGCDSPRDRAADDMAIMVKSGRLKEYMR